MDYFFLSGILVAVTFELLLAFGRSLIAMRRVSVLRSFGRHCELLTRLRPVFTPAACLAGVLALLGVLFGLARTTNASLTETVLAPVFWAEFYGLLLWWSPDVQHFAWPLLGSGRRALHAIQRARIGNRASRAEVEQVAESILRALYTR